MPELMIYGVTGYTGGLIAREAARRGLRPVLAGRSLDRVADLARELSLERRVFSLDAPDATADGIRGMSVVLHCAGPFSKTSKPMADACLREHVHYLDITGEEQVFEALAARDAEARAAGVVLFPGVGFDVVPSDCLAVHLKNRLPSATHLALGFQGGEHMSRGTALTVLESLPQGGLVRHHGALKRVPAAWRSRVIDFGKGPVPAMTIPWGDVSTAFHSTGVPNIEFYLAAPWTTRVAARLSRWIGGSRLLHEMLRKRILARPEGPTAEQRSASRCYLWGEATDAVGHNAVTRVQTPDGYDVTVQTSLAVATRVLGGHVTPGFQTPGRAFGADFILEVTTATRLDEPTD